MRLEIKDVDGRDKPGYDGDRYGLERDLVVHVAAFAAAGSHGSRLARRGRTGRAEIRSRFIGCEVTTTAGAAAVEHRQGRVEALQDHLGGIALDVLLVSPFAR